MREAGDYKAEDATCTSSGESVAGGIVTITRLAPSVVGTLDLSYPSGTVTGSFVAPPCPSYPVDAGAMADAGAAACTTAP